MVEHAVTDEQTLASPSLTDNVSFAQDVLGMQDGQTEEQIEDFLMEQAKELGVDVEALLLREAKRYQRMSTPSDLPRRSQESVASKASQSTGFMSTFSDMSRDIQVLGRGRSRASLTFREYDALVARGIPNGRHSASFSPPTTPSHSVFSLPLPTPGSSPKRPFRRIRGLSMLRLHRTPSSSSLQELCPHCPQDAHSQRRAVHKLPCGHRLCTQALRTTIKAASEDPEGAVPCCCGVPIPGNLVEHVTTQAEQHALLDNLEQWEEAASITESPAGEPRTSGASRRPEALTTTNRTVSDESKVDSVDPKTCQELDKAARREDFKLLQEDQAKQRDRFLSWMEQKRAALEAQQSQLRQQLLAKHESSMEEMMDAHDLALAELEDKQVQAEADMREAHTKEKQDNATALKHMEAYCSGTYSTGEPHNRTVTDQDRAELEKTRRLRDQMDAKHESAINVLRGEQSRRTRFRQQKQDRELQDLTRTQRKEELDLEKSCGQELHALEEWIAEKRHRMNVRWQLQTAIYVKQVEAETGTQIQGRLPSMDWPSRGGSPALGQNATAGVPLAAADEQDMHACLAKKGISTGYAFRGPGSYERRASRASVAS
jgi:hypothetical protein